MYRLNIRKAVPEDAQTIAEIAAESSYNQLKNRRTALKKGFLISDYTKEDYEAFIREHDECYVIEKNGKMKGFLLAFQDDQLDYSELINKRIQRHAKNGFIVIKQICIRKNARQRGYGRRLFEHVMSSIDKDIYLSVVLEPYNGASVEFHSELGFKQVITITPEDQIKRGIFYWNHIDTKPNYHEEIVMEQYRQALDLYKHEDTLNWSKVNHLFYITSGLIGIIGVLTGFTTEFNRDFYIFLLIVSVIGMLSSVLFLITILSGVEYMQKRKKAAVEIEKSLMRLGGTDVISVLFNQSDRRFKRSPTTTVMKLLPCFTTLLWGTIFVVSVIKIL